jgi:hypothetical protein
VDVGVRVYVCVFVCVYACVCHRSAWALFHALAPAKVCVSVFRHGGMTERDG